MAKRIKSSKTKDSGYNFLISANLDKKKLVKNVKKTLLSSLNNKNSLLPLSDLTITVDGIKKTTPNYWKIISIILFIIIIGFLLFIFKFISFQNLSPVTQKPTPEIIYITPTTTPTPKVVNRNINVLILNASRYQGIAKKLKNTLNQNKFNKVIIGNNKKIIDSVLIEYKPGCELEAKYLKDNYLGLSNAILSETKDSNSSNDIIITLGKSYIAK
jgi:hypothetical protein